MKILNEYRVAFEYGDLVTMHFKEDAFTEFAEDEGIHDYTLWPSLCMRA